MRKKGRVKETLQERRQEKDTTGNKWHREKEKTNDRNEICRRGGWDMELWI
jgi:hypothetical protein